MTDADVMWHRARERKPTDAELIDKIEQIRGANNQHWMDLVRLAVELDPVRAKALLRQIAACDQQIRQHTEQLAQ